MYPVSSQSIRTEPTLSNIIKMLKSQDSKLVSISTKLSIHENKTDALLSKVGELTSDILNLTKENDELKTQIDSLKVRVNSSDTSLSNNNSTGTDSQTIAHEAHKRIEKSNNIIMFNIKEGPVDSQNLPKSLSEAIFKALNLNISVLHATRGGKISSKPRPFIVKLGSRLEMLSILKSKRKLSTIDGYKHIYLLVLISR